MKRPSEAVAYLINDQTGEKSQLNVKVVSPTEDLLNQFQLRSFIDETNLTKTLKYLLKYQMDHYYI